MRIRLCRFYSSKELPDYNEKLISCLIILASVLYTCHYNYPLHLLYTMSVQRIVSCQQTNHHPKYPFSTWVLFFYYHWLLHQSPTQSTFCPYIQPWYSLQTNLTMLHRKEGKFLKHFGFWDFPYHGRGNEWVSIASAATMIVTRSLLTLKPDTIFSYLESSDLHGSDFPLYPHCKPRLKNNLHPPKD